MQPIAARHLPRHLATDEGRIGRVDGRRVATLVLEAHLHAMGRLDAVADAAHAFFQRVLQFGAEGPHRAAEHSLFRQHVVGMAGMEAGDADHRGLQRVDAAADQGLQRLHQGGTGQHRVGALVGHGGMAAAAVDGDFETIGAGHHRPFHHGEAARRQSRPVVQAEHHFHREFFEQAFLHHVLAAALVLLGRLEDEVDGAIEAALVAQSHQRLGRAEQHRRVAVVAAGMHLPLVFRAVRKAVEFGQRQRVHVGAQADGAGAAAAGQPGDHAGAGQAAMHLDADGLELGGDDIGGALLVKSQFRVGMDVAADGRDARGEVRQQVSRVSWPSFEGPSRGRRSPLGGSE